SATWRDLHCNRQTAGCGSTPFPPATPIIEAECGQGSRLTIPHCSTMRSDSIQPVAWARQKRPLRVSYSCRVRDPVVHQEQTCSSMERLRGESRSERRKSEPLSDDLIPRTESQERRSGTRRSTAMRIRRKSPPARSPPMRSVAQCQPRANDTITEFTLIAATPHHRSSTARVEALLYRAMR